VFYIGYRNPGLLAKAATTLDHLSNGRFELGLGAGWHQWEAEAYGYEFAALGTRLDMLEEAATLIRSLLDTPRTDFSGAHFSAVNASCLPPPVQRRLPIWIGGVGEKRTLRLAARLADGWNAAYVGPEEFARLGGVLDHWCDVEDRDPAAIRRGINLTFQLARNAAGVERERSRMAAEWGTMAERVAAGALLCTPAEAVDRIGAYAAAGATDVNVALRAPWEPEALDAFLEEVVPAVRASGG
ncbi:MAG: LLM class flavin-dependent oxidoreductase, partial [Pseudomonadales bacterium]|nr:LLM class flavin-dependent oxidoreductase [Pseudomonadales bacterium]